MKFKNFLLNEDKSHLGHRIGDVLNAIHDLKENGENMGTRQLTNNSEKIVNQIRRILHTHWSKAEEKQLKVLQKVGVAIMKAIEDKNGDIMSIISTAGDEIENAIKDMGVPQNSLGTDQSAEDEPIALPDSVKPEVKSKPKQQQQPQNSQQMS